MEIKKKKRENRAHTRVTVGKDKTEKKKKTTWLEKKEETKKKKGGSLESKLGNSEEAHIHTESTGRKRYILMYMPILNGVLVVFFFLYSLSFAIKASHGSCIRWNCSWSTTAWSVVLLLDKENSTLCRWGGRVSSSQNNVGRNNLATPYLLQRHADTHTHTQTH